MQVQLRPVGLDQIAERVLIPALASSRRSVVTAPILASAPDAASFIPPDRPVPRRGGVYTDKNPNRRTDAAEGQGRGIYGAGGAIGGAVARAFASEGADVFLTGRSLAPVELRRGGETTASAHAAEVDALDEQGDDDHLAQIVDRWPPRHLVRRDRHPQRRDPGRPARRHGPRAILPSITTHATSYS